MSWNAIEFDRHDGRFYNDGGKGFGPAELGADVAYTLLEGSEDTSLGVTVNYVITMLRITGATGDFFDTKANHDDHRFDPNTPTIGKFGERRKLRLAMRSLDEISRTLSGVSEDLSLKAFNLGNLCEDEADKLDPLTDRSRKPLAGRFTLPTVSVRDDRVGSDAIWYESLTDTFRFGMYEASPKQIGRLIALSLLCGEEWVTVGSFELTVQYLVEMLRLTGKHGRFVDFNDDLFDANVPTPNTAYTVFESR
jgi:hypothetical protein